jgi:hypothetical protein
MIVVVVPRNDTFMRNRYQKSIRPKSCVCVCAVCSLSFSESPLMSFRRQPRINFFTMNTTPRVHTKKWYNQSHFFLVALALARSNGSFCTTHCLALISNHQFCFGSFFNFSLRAYLAVRRASSCSRLFSLWCKN